MQLVQPAPAPVGPSGNGSPGQVLVSDGTATPEWTTARMEQTFTSQVSVTMIHNFGVRPQVQVLDTTDSVMIPMAVTHLSVNVLKVAFSIPTSGTIIAGMF